MTIRSLCLSGLLALAGCEAPTAPTDREQLDQARALWASQGGPSYSFEVSRACECLLAGRRVLVTVEGGIVSAATYLDSKEPVETAFLSYFRTVPDLFDLIEDALDRKAASLEVSYDASYGYPTQIDIDYSATIADDELRLTAQDLALRTAFSRRP